MLGIVPNMSSLLLPSFLGGPLPNEPRSDPLLPVIRQLRTPRCLEANGIRHVLPFVPAS